MMHKIEINAQRLWGRLNTIGAVGEDPEGGVSRFAWEPAYKSPAYIPVLVPDWPAVPGR